MQNTRLSTLLVRGATQAQRWLFNPWRRLSVLLLSLLFGFFLATVIATTTGQTADLDIFVAAIILTFVEIISWLTYSRRSSSQRSSSTDPALATTLTPNILIEMLNALKIGLVFGLFVEAFKLGS